MSKINDFVANVIVGAYGTVLLSYKAYFNVNCDSKLRGIVKRNLLRLMALFWGQVYLPPPPGKKKKNFLSYRLVSGSNKNVTKVTRLLVSEGRGNSVELTSNSFFNGFNDSVVIFYFFVKGMRYF